MRDVAAHAGVSKATVSAVLNSLGRVRRDTRDRVLHAVAELDYRPGVAPGAAAPMGGGRGIGLLVRQADSPHAAAVVAGAREATAAHGYTLLVASSEGDGTHEQRAVELLRAHEVVGLLMAPVLGDDSDLSHLFELVRRRRPFVLLETVRGVPASVVDVDRVQAAGGAATHLIALGHTRLAHFAGPAAAPDAEEHVDGVRRACGGTSVAFTDADAVPAGTRVEDGYQAALAYFAGLAPVDRPTGVTCYNDLVAVGVCRALAELGLRVPDDVSVVGVGDAPLAEYGPVPLTTVRVPGRAMGRLAAELLLVQIAALATAVPVRPERHLFGGELVVRASTRAPPELRARPAAPEPRVHLPAR